MERGGQGQRREAGGGNAGRPHGGAKVGSVDRFNLEKIKEQAFRGFEDTAPAKFRQFYKSALYDRFLHTIILYFVAKFQEQALIRRKQSTAATPGSAKQQDTSGGVWGSKTLDMVEAEMDQHMKGIAPLYAQIIMSQSDYGNTQMDKLFFESFYEATNQILQEAFIGQRKGPELEAELGRIFRTDQFNIARRRQETKKHGDTVSVRELYALRHEGDAALNMRILSSLFPKRENASVLQATLTQSPIITHLLPNRGAARNRHRAGGAKATARGGKTAGGKDAEDGEGSEGKDGAESGEEADYSEAGGDEGEGGGELEGEEGGGGEGGGGGAQAGSPHGGGEEALEDGGGAAAKEEEEGREGGHGGGEEAGGEEGEQ